jgi:hypothetical protein
VNPRAYPCREIDHLAQLTEGGAYAARVAASEMATRAAESIQRRESLHVLLHDRSHKVRCEALECLLHIIELSPHVTVESLRSSLRRVVTCGETEEELLLAWRIISHCATYFHDAPRLLGLGVHGASIAALLSPVATVASRRAVTRSIAALCSGNWEYYAFCLERPTAQRLATAAPAALAHVALRAPGGVSALFRHRLVGVVLPRVVTEEYALASDLVDALLAHPQCGEGAAAAVRRMVADPAECVRTYAHVLEALVCGNAQLARTLIGSGALQGVVRYAAGGDAEAEAQVAAVELAHAALESSGVADPAIVVTCLRWAYALTTPPRVRTCLLEYLTESAKRSEACARVVVAFGITDDDDDSYFLAGEAFSHASVAADYPSQLAEVLQRATFGRFAHVHFALSVAETPAGASAVTAELGRITPAIGHDDEVLAETAKGVLLACAVGHREAVLRALRACIRRSRG